MFGNWGINETEPLGWSRQVGRTQHRYSWGSIFNLAQSLVSEGLKGEVSRLNSPLPFKVGIGQDLKIGS